MSVNADSLVGNSRTGRLKRRQMFATTLAKEKQGREFAKQNGAMASPGSSFLCLCDCLSLNGTVVL